MARPARGGGPRGRLARRLAPTLLAAVPAVSYAVLEPPSGDLAAHLLRAKLVSVAGFGLWNNWWYAGHHVASYSVLFPPVAAALTPQLAAALAAILTAALFEQLAHRHFGEEWLAGSLWFAAGTAASLYAGRLTFAFGLAGALATALALQRRRTALAGLAAVGTALCSPVAAIFVAVAGAAHAGARISRTDGLREVLPGALVVGAALLPVGALALTFPEGGTEPFVFSAFLPLPLLGISALLALPKPERTLRLGTALYTLVCVIAYAVPSALGSNVVRLGELVAGPLAALLWWRGRRGLLLVVAIPLLYLEFQAPIRDVTQAVGNPSVSAAYYRPLLSFLAHQGGGPFRVEIPFTRFHWEAYEVAQRFALARGWERQLDIKDNGLFYGGALTAEAYRAWLNDLAVRYVALPDATLDYSARREAALIRHGLPYLRPVRHLAHWQIYQVSRATPLAQGVATARRLGPNWTELTATGPGLVLVHVRFTPYWAITTGAGCVAPGRGGMTQLTLRRAGRVRLGVRFALGRVQARSPRCTD